MNERTRPPRSAKHPCEDFFRFCRWIAVRRGAALQPADRDDLEAELRLYLFSVWDLYDPARGASRITWLHLCLWRRAGHWLNHQRKGSEGLFRRATGLSPYLPDPRPEPEVQAIAADEAERLWESVALLSPKQSVCVAGIYGLRLTAQETAARSGVRWPHRKAWDGVVTLRQRARRRGEFAR